MEWLTKVQRGQRTQIVKDRGFYVDYSLELVQTPEKSALLNFNNIIEYSPRDP